jgi:hypothetical protein
VAPVTTAVGDVAGVNVGVFDPTILVQLATPGAGVFAALVHTVTLHKFWSGPALAAGDGMAEITTFRSSEVEQPAVAIEYLKVYVPATKPEAVAVLGVVEAIDAILGSIPTCVHVPIVDALPKRFTSVAAHKA